MIIHRRVTRPRFPSHLRRRWLLAGAVALVGSAAAAWAVVADGPVRLWVFHRVQTWAAERGYYPSTTETGHLSSELGFALRNRVGAAVRFSELPRLDIDIPFRHYDRLRRQRDQALAADLLIQGDDDYVPGTIRLRDRSVRVDIRLKGDIVNDLRGDKWSFRVHVKRDDHLFGLRRFNLHPARARDYHVEAVFLEHMRRMGVLAPRYMFVVARLNGEDLGVMGIEEHFSRELLESQDRRESVILKLDESRFWAFSVEDDHRQVGPFSNFFVNEMQPFRSTRVQGSATLSEDLRVATGLYRAFLAGSLAPSDVFDARMWGRFLAVIRSWEARHAVSWTNLRFYYNPITARLEPIAYDAERRSFPESMPPGIGGPPLTTRLLADSVIWREYRRALETVHVQLSDGEHLEALRALETRHLRDLHGRFPFLTRIDLAAIAETAGEAWEDDTTDTTPRNTERLVFPPSMLHPGDLLYARLITDGPRRYLELENVAPFDVIVVPPSGDSASSGRARDTVMLAATPIGTMPSVARVALAPGEAVDRVYVARAEGGVGAWVHPTPYYPALTSRPVPAPSLDAVAAHPFLNFDPTTRTVTARPGRWTVDGSISLPRGVGLTLPAGTVLEFDSAAVLVVRGPTRFEGTADQPVRLEGRAAGAAVGPWRGVVVFNTDAEALWSHVTVRHASGVDLPDWHLTAGVTLYEGTVSLSGTAFVESRAEDALNLFRTSFTLRDITVSDAISDGIDIDFGRGEVTGATFTNIGWIGGGDALDASGAVVRLADARFDRVGDKAVSVGEGSDVRASDLTVDGAGAAVVSKDGSFVRAERIGMSDILHAGLMAYIKKPEFGGAVLDARGVTIGDGGRLAQAQIGSVLSVDGRLASREDLNVDSLYATVMRRGLRR